MQDLFSHMVNLKNEFPAKESNARNGDWTLNDHDWNSSKAQKWRKWAVVASNMKALINPAKEFGAYPESCGEALNPLTQEKDVVILMFY